MFGSSDNLPVTRIPASAVSVTDPDGNSVPVGYSTDNEEVTRGRNVYHAALFFDAPVDGDYLLQFRNTNPTRVIVSRSILDALKGVWGWFLVGGAGGLVFVAGLVMLIVGATRRGRAKRAQYAAWGPAPQWGPPPQQWGTPPQQQWAPPQPQWGAAPQQQWAPPPPPPPPQSPPPGPPPGDAPSS